MASATPTQPKGEGTKLNGEILSIINILDNQIANLNTNVLDLADNIKPILSDVSETVAGLEAFKEPNTQLGNLLTDLAQRVNYINCAVININSRVEL